MLHAGKKLICKHLIWGHVIHCCCCACWLSAWGWMMSAKNSLCMCINKRRAAPDSLFLYFKASMADGWDVAFAFCSHYKPARSQLAESFNWIESWAWQTETRETRYIGVPHEGWWSGKRSIKTLAVVMNARHYYKCASSRPIDAYGGPRRDESGWCPSRRIFRCHVCPSIFI